MSRLTLNILVPFAGLLSLASAGAPAALAPNCAGDAALQACVASAALTVRDIIHDGGRDLHVIVSVSLQVTNTTDYPVDVAFVDDESKWSFTPENAESIVPTNVSMDSRSLEFAGVTSCKFRHERDACNYTTLAPGRAYRIQVSYSGRLTNSAIPLAQIATKASLSGLLSVKDRGQHRFASLPVPEFAFGNGLANLR